MLLLSYNPNYSLKGGISCPLLPLRPGLIAVSSRTFTQSEMGYVDNKKLAIKDAIPGKNKITPHICPAYGSRHCIITDI